MQALLTRSLIVCGLFLVVTSSVVTPVEKVVELLTKLQAQIGEEGKTEAAQYDKFACFCKEQADNHRYAIEKSTEKLEQLAAQISKLEADIAELNNDIASLSKRITALEKEIKTAEALRAKQHAAYLVEEKDLADGIDALIGAIQALKESKAQMSNAKLNLAQVRSIAGKTLESIDKLPAIAKPSAAQLRADLKAIMMEPELTAPANKGTQQKQYAAKTTYEYHSNDIIATLQDLLKDFKKEKKDLDENEFQVQATHDKKVLGLSNEKEFAEKDKAEKEELVAQKTDDLHSAQEEEAAETEAKKADQAFMDELTEACQTKAEGWDNRSKTRAAELTAIAEAIEALASGVAPNYSANKKLVGLQKLGKLQRAADAHMQPAHRPSSISKIAEGKLSFMQLSQEVEQSVPRRMVQFLESEAKRLKSSVLASLASKVDLKAAEDHFVKVRAIIQALIDRLEADALSEADQKSLCDSEMKAATDARDTAISDIEKHGAAISRKEAEKQEVLGEIQVLQDEIAELNKALNEATQLRADEKAANEKTLAEALEGKEAVTIALNVLKEFYDGAAGASLVQGSSSAPEAAAREAPDAYKSYVAPNANRDGNTVSDLAPDMYHGDYSGKQEASRGILGLLEIILSDFERTETKVGEAEDKAQADFETFETDTQADIDAKEKDREEKESKVATLEDEIVTAKDDRIDAEKAHAQSLKELEKLKTMCVEGEETEEERKERREKEIEALKEALQIFEDWKN